MKRISLIFAVTVIGFLLFHFSASYLIETNLIEQSVQAEVTLVLGNPSNATSETSNSDNFLVAHDGYVLSYNKSRGTANWVTWHLSQSDIGTVDGDAFAPDTTLPSDWWVKPNIYRNSGYDKGHLCPAKDRSNIKESNVETYLMSNMQPQTARLNQQTWRYLEDYTRTLVKQGNEAYIYAGCYGDKGKIKDKVTIPTNCFKIIVILPEGNNDLRRIKNNTRVIAVDMPNDSTHVNRWKNYRTTVDDIEEKTGYNFLSTLPDSIEDVLEAQTDNG